MLLEFLWQEKVLFCWKICGKLESVVWKVLGIELLVDILGLMVDKLVG